jgi:hypothetical protein
MELQSYKPGIGRQWLYKVVIPRVAQFYNIHIYVHKNMQSQLKCLDLFIAIVAPQVSLRKNKNSLNIQLVIQH